ncbi:MAG: cohesin domain-containing protein [Candidatus Nomurabacteria bacterium]|nr:cohesin domain-containing protein [Candidatus Nomurabacteria bacterium]
MKYFKQLFSYKKNIIILAIIMYFFVPQFTHAASLSLLPSATSVSVNNIITVKISVNTEGTFINNVEAGILFPTDLLEVVSITKSSSIFSLWVEEPSFSNNAGKITFNGGVANPGFNGRGGSIASVVFKAKKKGTASILFADAAIRQNDGLGTDILTAKNSSVIQIGAPEVVLTPVPVVVDKIVDEIIPKPIVTSSSHPKQDSWYSADSASFSWNIPTGVTSIQTLFNKTPNSTPIISYDSSVTQKTLSSISDGTFYFHLRYSNKANHSAIAHYKINIDTVSPLSFSPVLREDNGKNYIKLNAVDSISGIDHYTLNMYDGHILNVKKSDLIDEEYLLPVLNEGNYSIVVTAYDKAGNHTESTVSLVAPVVSVPEISLNYKEIIKGEPVIIFGKSDYPNKHVEVTLESDGKEIKKYIQTINSDGTFLISTDNINTVGLIHIWAKNILSEKVTSDKSTLLSLSVKYTGLVKITRTLLSIIFIIILLIILLIIIYIGWHKYFGLKKKIHAELETTIEEIHKATLLLREELTSQLEMLEKIKIDRNLNKEEEKIFAEIEKNIETTNNFIEKKLKKLV